MVKRIRKSPAELKLAASKATKKAGTAIKAAKRLNAGHSKYQPKTPAGLKERKRIISAEEELFHASFGRKHRSKLR